MEMFNELFKKLVSLFAVEVEEADCKVLKVTPTFNVLVVEVVVYAAVSSQR